MTNTHTHTQLPTSRERHPEGADLYYDGDDPEGFRAEIKAEFGFDPAEPHPGRGVSWGEWFEADGRWYQGFPFFCPPEHLDAIYGDDERWEVGS